MRVGLDGIPLSELKTGVGHYTFELGQALACMASEDQFDLVSPFPYARVSEGESNQELPPNLRLLTTDLNALCRRSWWSIGLPFHINRSTFALFHGTNYNVPLWNRCPTILTIHDLSLILYPETHEKYLVRRARWRLPMMARAATAIITPSETVRRELCEHLKIKASKIFVTPLAPRRSFRRLPFAENIQTLRRLDIDKDFILFVGTIEPRKNLVTLARAFDEILRTTSLRPLLVIAGKQGWLSGELYSYLKRAQFDGLVRFTGYISDNDLCALYSSCRVFAYPSLYEGFGLPLLEAMACCAPVITSRKPSIMETVGDSARLVSPTDFRELAQTITGVLKNPHERDFLISAGLKRAAEFSWNRTASATLDVYRAILKR